MVREEVDSASLGHQEILLEAESSLIAPAMEMAVFSGRSPGLMHSGLFRGYPWRPGYAMVGRVLARGSNVPSVADGDRVLCLGSHASLQRYDASLSRSNAMLVPVGEDLEPHLAVAARFVRVAFAAMRAAAVRATDVVAVLGLGLMGNLTAQVLRLSGARVIGVSTSPLRTRLARAVGIEAVTSPSRAEHRRLILELAGNEGVTVAVDAAGSPAVATSGASVCRRGGRVVLLGTPRPPEEGDLGELFRHVHQKGLDVIGVNEWGDHLPLFPREPRPSLWWDYLNALRLIRTGRVQVAPLITDCITPAELPAMYWRLHERPGEHLGVVVAWKNGPPPSAPGAVTAAAPARRSAG